MTVIPNPIWSRPIWFIAIHCSVWWLAQIIINPGLDSYGDMVEVYAWSQHWLMGSDKHPQFLPWMASLWFRVMPQTVASFYLLSAINLAAALLGIWALGLALGMTRVQVTLALALQVLAFPYLSLSAKLNMNSILLALWPWLTLAFVRLIQTHGARRLIWAAAFGLLSALAMMAKYYTVVLLTSLLAATLMPALRPVWRSAAPLVFVATFLAVLLPHLLWLLSHQQSVAYAMEQGAGSIDWHHLLIFALVPLFYWPIPVLIGLGWLYRGSFDRRLIDLLRCKQTPSDTVLWFATVGPLVITLILGVLGFVELSTPWAIPIGFTYTLLLVRNRTREDETRADRLAPGFKVVWPALMVLAVFYAGNQALGGKRWYYMPEADASRAVLDGWAQGHPTAPRLRWAAAANDAARLAYFTPGSGIEALPSFPNTLPTYYPPLLGWRTMPGVVLCGIHLVSDTAQEDGCQAEALDWARRHGLKAETFDTMIQRQGWQFPLSVPFHQAAVFVWP